MAAQSTKSEQAVDNPFRTWTVVTCKWCSEARPNMSSNQFFPDLAADHLNRVHGFSHERAEAMAKRWLS